MLNVLNVWNMFFTFLEVSDDGISLCCLRFAKEQQIKETLASAVEVLKPFDPAALFQCNINI